MSIANAWCERDRVLLCVDTAIGEPGTALGEASKATCLVHMNAVIAVRGRFPFFLGAQARCLGLAVGFDDLLERLPALLAETGRATEAMLQKFGIHGDEENPLHCNGLLTAGWSPKRERMRVVLFEQVEKDTGFSPIEIEPGYGTFGPGFDDLPQLELPVTSTSLARMAKLQVRLMREQFPSAIIGGRLIVFQIRREGVTFAPVCDLK